MTVVTRRSKPQARSARLAEPEEIAGAIIFLCSEHASYTSGAAWSVDGGTVQVII
jgi:NAD(P)-dependent dehydrogenase (short-subunit alcohol dehydrogenase family)